MRAVRAAQSVPAGSLITHDGYRIARARDVFAECDVHGAGPRAQREEGPMRHGGLVSFVAFVALAGCIDEDEVSEVTQEVGEPCYLQPSEGGCFASGRCCCGGKIATFVGTEGNDILIGTAGNDVFWAKAGNDIIFGLGGNDTICDGPGNDTVRAGPGNDSLIAGAGNDLLDGDDGDDQLSLAPFVEGRHVMRGGAGDDSMYVTAFGPLEIDGGPGNDWMNIVAFEPARIRGGDGDDTIAITWSEHDIDGGRGNDTILIGAGTSFSGPGPTVHGGPGNDELAVDTSSECLPFGVKLYGDDGADNLIGSTAADTLDGGAGNDFCDGDSGIDTVVRCERRGDENACGNGKDDDGDQLIDCADPDCFTCVDLTTRVCTSEAGACNDGFDNDSDGLVDCADPDCPCRQLTCFCKDETTQAGCAEITTCDAAPAACTPRCAEHGGVNGTICAFDPVCVP